MNDDALDTWHLTIEGRLFALSSDAISDLIPDMSKPCDDEWNYLSVELDCLDGALGVWVNRGEYQLMFTMIPWSVVRTALAIHDAEMKESGDE